MAPTSKSNSIFDLAKMGIASASLALALTSFAQAQQFQEPRLPSPAAIQQSSAFQQAAFQSRVEHSEALKAQMERARREQGATDDFAQKAYEAQQAYQRELAHQEYEFYLKQQKDSQAAAAYSGQTASYQPTQSQPQSQPQSQRQPQNTLTAPAFKRIPRPNQTDQSNRPSTFVPPVHVAPQTQPAVASFGDQPRIQREANRSETQVARRQTNEPIGSGVLQQTSYQEPVRYGNNSPAGNQLAAQPVRRAPRPQTAPSRAAQQPTYTPPRVAPPAYIIDGNDSVGLQDRIASLLSKPQYRGISGSSSSPQSTAVQQERGIFRSANLGSAQLAQSRSPQSRQPQTQQQPRNYAPQRKPRQPLYRPEVDRATQANRANAQNLEAMRLARSNKIRRDLEVQQAYEMQQRIPATAPRRRPVQQVAMVEPVQDPFNDHQSMTLPQMSQSPTMRSPRASYPQTQMQRSEVPAQVQFEATDVPTRSFDSGRSFETAQMSRPQTDRLQTRRPQEPEITQPPMRQISVLSNRGQDQPQEDSQFGSAPSRQPPTEDTSSLGGQFGSQMPDELQKADDELENRLRELEQDDASSRIEEGMKELDRQLEEELRDSGVDDEEKQSIMDDEDSMDDGLDDDEDEMDRNKPTEKTCDEFRAELLTGSIRDISLDLSPLASPNRNQFTAISRSWTDRSGNVVADGTMVDLRRGYVIIEGVNGRQKIPYAKLSDGDWAAISEYWRLPTLCSVGNEGGAYRNWIPQTYTWKASSLCHKPLFFENIQLERYGHSHGPFTQPIQSVGHFFVSLITVPYQSAITPANECQYALGFYRPGNCAPWLKDPVPFSLSGARRQALITTGAAFVP